MKRFIRLLLLAGVLAGLAAWLKEIVDRAEPPSESPADRPQSRSGSPTPNGRGASSGGTDAPTREELYEEAQRLEIKGRSKMSKQELERAVQSARS